MARSTQTRLTAYQRSYRQLAERVAEIGYIAAGSITCRHTRCGTASCRCEASPPEPSPAVRCMRAALAQAPLPVY